MPKRPDSRRALSLIAAALLCAALAARAEALTAEEQNLRDLYEQLVETDTTHSSGSTADAAAIVERRLRAAGLPVEDISVVGPKREKMNLVARLRGRNQRKPLLLLAHLDVVEARREDWTTDPFTLVEQDGYFYARGSIDDKAMAAMFTEIVVQMLGNKEKPDRDVILALTADEETGPDNGVEWLLKNRPELVNASVVINEGGGGRIRDGKYIFNGIQASEKSYMTFELEVRDKGGHSSVPSKENAIYRLAAALQKLEAYQFPVELNPVTRDYYQRMAKLESGQLAADMEAILRDPPDPLAVQRLSETPAYNASLRTTCVATRLEGGHADNALPQMAKATVNCRILPGHSTAEVQSALAKAIGDEKVAIKPTEPDTAAPGSELDPGIIGTVEMVTTEKFPGLPVIATMSTGATDSRYFRRAGVPSYGVSGIFMDMNDIRAHGKDERVGVKQFFEGYGFLKRLVDALSY